MSGKKAELLTFSTHREPIPHALVTRRNICLESELLNKNCLYSPCTAIRSAHGCLRGIVCLESEPLGGGGGGGG